MAEVYQDIFGRRIRLTNERIAHIVSSREDMPPMMDRIGETLQSAEVIRRSNTDNTDPKAVRLYYKWHNDTPLGDR